MKSNVYLVGEQAFTRTSVERLPQGTYFQYHTGLWYVRGNGNHVTRCSDGEVMPADRLTSPIVRVARTGKVIATEVGNGA